METTFIGVIPSKKNKDGKAWRTNGLGVLGHKLLSGVEYLCRINGGYRKYFFVEERYLIPRKNKPDRLGNIKNIHHFNREQFQLEIT